MKKLVVLALVSGLICASGLWASTLSLEIYVDGEPYCGEDIAVGTTVEVYVVQLVPDPNGIGGEITITMAASGGSATDTTPLFNSPEAGMFAGWDWFLNFGVAFIDNGDGTWWAWFEKTSNLNSPLGMNGTPGIGSWLGYDIYGWAYESTIAFSFIFTGATELVFGGTWDGVNYDGVVGGKIGYFFPPGCCYGDVTGDRNVSGADLSAIVMLLAPAFADSTPPYTVCPPPPGFANADVTGDGCISGADLSAIVGYLNPSYAGTTPPYTGPCMPSP